MPRVKRRGHVSRGYTLDQECYVQTGIEFPGFTPLTSAEFEEIYWRHRDEWMERSPAGHRPYGWWRVESPGTPFKHERDEDALIRLRVALSARERHTLERQQPPGPCSYGLLYFSTNYLCQFRSRMDTWRVWHSEEGRPGMADAYAARINEIDSVLSDREARCDPGPPDTYDPGNSHRFAKEALCPA